MNGSRGCQLRLDIPDPAQASKKVVAYRVSLVDQLRGAKSTTVDHPVGRTHVQRTDDEDSLTFRNHLGHSQSTLERSAAVSVTSVGLPQNPPVRHRLNLSGQVGT